MSEQDLARTLSVEEVRHLAIDKESLPYRFTYDYQGHIFEMEIHYNSEGDFFTIDLSLLQNELKKVLMRGEKLMLGQMLFEPLFYLDIETPPLMPWDFSRQALRCGWEEMDQIYLVVMDDAAVE